MIEYLFEAAKLIVCAHAACGLVGNVAVGKGIMWAASAKEYGEHPSLAFQDVKSLQDGLDQALGAYPPRFILWGESNHGDLRQLAFLAEPRTLKILADKGVRRIFVEWPLQDQHEMDWVGLLRIQDQFRSSGTSTCGRKVGQQKDILMTQLLKNANAVGIRIMASDVGNGKATAAYWLNYLAMSVESRFLSVLSKTAANVWESIGTKALIKYRLGKDKKVAEYINRHTLSGPSVVYWGARHISNDLPTSLRRSLHGALTLSFCTPPAAGEEEGIAKVMHESGKGMTDHYGLPVKPLDFLLNLSTATVQKCAA
ncbi:MAG: hypothetical protein WCD70_11505 [Alphaproteobacteria bacterium]